MMNEKTCKCPHHSIIPLLVTGFGILFLLGEYGAVTWDAVSLTWPMLVVLGGLTKLMGRKCDCCK